MELCEGITGFRQFDDPPLPSTDLPSFRSHCWAAARTLGARVAHPFHESGGVAANFATLVVELPTGAVAVLLNLHFPVVAFARPSVAGGVAGPVEFTDCEPLALALRRIGAYEVASRIELERPVRSDDFRLLSPAEMRQIKYWKPNRVGDIVFNFWD
jgi:hypothetical protein